jgi:SSS family solute:Na+ symporter/sodium/pantothenate symporter
VSATDLTVGIFAAGAAYIAVLVVIAILSRRARRETSLADFYLAGRTLGPMVLLLTLFATQYSGNSLSGFPGQTYREGIAYYMSVTFMVGIVTGYLLYAPRLFRIARKRGFVTPSDFLAARFASPALNYLSATIFSVALLNFLLAQLMAMGHAAAGLTGDRIPYAVGVIGGAAIILGYELLGGMRAVAWTDALQGAVLMGGLLLAVILLTAEIGSPAEVLRQVAAAAPDKMASPSLTTCLLWVSNFTLLFLGAPLYPQAIQRIYAARGLNELRQALAAMAFLPHIAITTVVFIGLAGIALFPAGSINSDQVTFEVLAFLVDHQPLAYVPVVIVMMAVVAAIMSTADSCLLSLSSILTKDFVGRIRGYDEMDSERLARIAPISSVVIMVLMTTIAVRPLTTLWGLLVIKFEILIQMSPAFVLGTLRRQPGERAFEARDILAGLGVGLVVALGLYASGHRQINGLHAGTLGVVANYATCWLSRRLAPARRSP